MARTRKGKIYELFESKVPLFFGGTLIKGHAKKQRPLSKKHAVHLAIKLPNVPMRIARKLFQSFLRAVTGLIARQVLGTEKGSP